MMLWKIPICLKLPDHMQSALSSHISAAWERHSHELRLVIGMHVRVHGRLDAAIIEACVATRFCLTRTSNILL